MGSRGGFRLSPAPGFAQGKGVGTLGKRARILVAPEWLSVAEAAEVLDVSTRTAYRWIGEGLLPAYRIGHPLRVKRVDLEELISKGRPA